MISANTEENADRITKEKLGDIMVTGATGFWGSMSLKHSLTIMTVRFTVLYVRANMNRLKSE